MHIDDHRPGLAAHRISVQNRLDSRERVIKRPLHEDLAEDLGHQNLAALCRVEQSRAFAGRGFRKIQRADHPRFRLDVLKHVALIECVIAQRHTIGPRIENPLGMCACEAHAAAGIFAIDHDKIEAPFRA